MSLLLVYFHQLILSIFFIFYQLMKFQPQAHAIATIIGSLSSCSLFLVLYICFFWRSPANDAKQWIAGHLSISSLALGIPRGAAMSVPLVRFLPGQQKWCRQAALLVVGQVEKTHSLSSTNE